ncbi:hypothetical protein A2935_01520 [Candidatus Wolfebacteria bacterium RIFCSPLOWO2_01_FULL_47_17b]|uniref:2-dehydropantoate 2-reductase n=1 Tax=Candidatus Wolfebacteria bacterium RIFCSPLOWO2_01_FULL_47_17b TaxID=1802558 RepID=A0A1F8DYP2_9BACT|nr:MAG: hypothetical protein A2935_01520 [Candidatus Wolfebacteria bacterium RIFCSPLOWO2_01_FULL_47_17b]
MDEIEKKMKIGILGPGAVGGFLASLFWKSGERVLCIGKAGDVSAIKERGITIESPIFGDFVARPEIDTELRVPIDILFITVKSSFLKEALRAVNKESIKSAVIIPLLNGIGHAEIIREILGTSVAAGTIGQIEVVKDLNGSVRQVSRQHPHIDIASDGDVSSSRLEEIVDAIRRAGVSASILRSEAEVIWKKLVRLNATASLTAAFQKPIGVIRSDPDLRRLLEGIVREGVAIAGREGTEIDSEETMEEIDRLPETLMTSLSRDVAARVPSEIDSITGGVLKKANFYGIPVPFLEGAYKRIQKRIS